MALVLTTWGGNTRLIGRNGVGLRERAAWLLKFAEMDLGARLWDDRQLRLEAQRHVDSGGGRLLQWGELQHVHRHVREGLRALRERRPWRYEVPGEHVLVPGAQGLSGPLIGRFETRDPWDRYVVNAMDLLAALGDRLRMCQREDCGRAFVAVKGQRYCAECAEALQKARVTAWRKRNAQRVRDLAHGAYVRRKRRETGRANLKIERRPRVGRPGGTR